MVRTLASLVMSVLTGAFLAGPLAAQSIVGAWYFGDARSDDSGVVVFLDNGHYFHIVNADVFDAPGGFDGFERGTYSWNPTTGAFLATTLYNGDGDLGLSELSGVPGMVANVYGDTLRVEIFGDVVTLNRVTGTNPIVGAWFSGNPAVPNDSGVVVFLQNGNYFLADEGVASGGGRTGIEHGTYTWNATTGAFTSSRSPAPYVDTNGTWGLSGATGPVTVRISGDGRTLTATEAGQSLIVARVGATYVAPAPVPSNTAVEYYHVDFEHYFVTSLPAEIANLDAGNFYGWARTGQSFKVFPLGEAGTANVCRFFSAAFAPRSSHFYTPYTSECTGLKANPKWTFEGEVFGFRLPDPSGNCPGGTVPLYRFYNNSANQAPNHRFTTSPLVRAQMVAQGWTAEGLGPQVVFACVPQ
jgi:hypothetical protein